MFYEVCPEAKDSKPGQIHPEKLPLRTAVLIRGDKQPDMYSWDKVMMVGEGMPDDLLLDIQENLDFDDLVKIQYTSGTTGFPKGVVLTHHNLVNNGSFIGSE